MLEPNYLDCLTELGVGGAHPGGLKLTKHVVSKEKMNKTTKILDAGCGTGQSVAYLSETYHCAVTALDVNQTMIQKAKERMRLLGYHAEFIQGNIENLPFHDDHFDIILCESVLAFTDLSKSLRECNRVLNKAGVLLAIEMVLEKEVPHEEMNRLSTFYGIPRFYTVSEWMKRIEEAGFIHVKVDKINLEFDEFDVENATDFSFSDQIDERLFDLLEQHGDYMKKYEKILGFRVFRASF